MGYKERNDMVAVMTTLGTPGEIRPGFIVIYNQEDRGNRWESYYITDDETTADLLTKRGHGFYGQDGRHEPCDLICDQNGQWGVHRVYPTITPGEIDRILDVREKHKAALEHAKKVANARAKLTKEDMELLGIK